jgi:hypothetical protein
VTRPAKPLSESKQKEIATRAELGPRLRRATETIRLPTDPPTARFSRTSIGKAHPTRDSAT